MLLQQQMQQLNIKEDKEQDITKLYNCIYDIILDLMTIDIKREIQDNSKFYSKVHQLYQDINKDIIDIVNRFNTIAINITDATNKIEIQQPSIKKLPLLVPKIFNNTYINSKYTTIEKTLYFMII